MVQSQYHVVEQLGYRVTVGGSLNHPGRIKTLIWLIRIVNTLGNGRWRTFAGSRVWRNCFICFLKTRAIHVTSSCGCGCRNGGKKVWRVLFYLTELRFGILHLIVNFFHHFVHHYHQQRWLVTVR